MADSTVRIVFKGDTSSALGSVNKLDSGFGQLTKTVKVAGLALAAGFGAALTSSVKQAVAFEKSMRNVNSIAKLSESQFKALEKQVLGLSKSTAKGPKDLADGLYGIVSSGFKANDAVKILAVSAKAATAGLTTTATASKAVTAALNAYHLGADSARKVSDILFETVNKGVLTFEELAQQMGDLVPAAAPLGVKLEEVGAAMATLTLQGVPAAEAATRVKNTMLQLASPSKELSKLLRENGFASGEAAIKALGFSGVLRLLQTATGGNVTETAKLTPEIRSLLGVVGLTGRNLETYNANLRAMENAQKGAGATAAAFAEQAKSVAFQWDKAKAQLSAIAITVASRLLPAIGEMISRFNEWLSGPGFDRLVEKIKAVVASVQRVVDAMGGWENAFKLVLSGLLVAKLVGIVNAIAGIGTASATAAGVSGVGGLMAKLSLLAATAPITIPIAAVITMKVFEDEIVSFIESHPMLAWLDSRGTIDPKALTGAAIAALPEWAQGAAIRAMDKAQPQKPVDTRKGRGSGLSSGGTGAGLQAPTSWKGSHTTDNLGWGAGTALDIMAYPGTEIGAPEAGVVTGHGSAQGGDSVTFTADSGWTYWLGHVSRAVPVGTRLKKGETIAVVSGDHPNPHLHIDKIQTVKLPAAGGSKTTGVSARGTSGAGSASTATPKKAAAGIGSDLSAAFDSVSKSLTAGTALIAKRVEEAAKAAAQISRVRDAFKKALGNGIISDSELQAVVKGLDGLKGKIAAGMRNAAEAVMSARESFRKAFDTFVGFALQAFDKSHDRMRDALTVALTFGDVQVKLGLGDLTPTEKLLADRAKAAREADLQNAVDAAEAKLRLARESGEGILEAEKEAQDARAAQETYFLEQKAAVERQAADSALAAVQQNFDEQTAIERVAFETQLRAIGERMALGKLTYQGGLDAIKRLFQEYQVPFGQQGEALGGALQNAMLGAFSKLESAMVSLARAMAALVKQMGGHVKEAQRLAGQIGVGIGVGGAVSSGTSTNGMTISSGTGSTVSTLAIPPDDQFSSIVPTVPSPIRTGVQPFAKGTLHVPHTGLFQLHAGEQVVRAAKVSSMRHDWGGWGGDGRSPQVHVTIANGMEWLRDFINIEIGEANTLIGMRARNRALTRRR